MADRQMREVVHHIRNLAAGQAASDVSDRDLLDRFLAGGDEAAFAALVERHGGMVLGVCRRVLRNAHDAEDACQAAFLVLARKAASIRNHESLASWLHGVGFFAATRLKRQLARRAAREALRREVPQADVAAEVSWREMRALLDDELARLPDRFRSPLVLCYLEGRTRDEAAQQLGWTVGALRGRLERGRECLRARLARRGLTLSAALFAGALVESSASAAPPAEFVVLTVKAGLLYAAGRAPADVISVQVVTLAEGVLKAMLLSKLKIAAAVLVALAVLGASAASLTRQAFADRPAAAPAQLTAAEQPAEPPAKEKKDPADKLVTEKKPSATEKKQDEPLPTGVNGIVKAVDAEKGTLTVESRDGEETYSLASNGRIDIDGKPGRLDRLPVGANVNLTHFVGPKTAGHIQAAGRFYFGSAVTAVDAEKGTITIKDKDAGKTFTVAPNALITVDGKHTKLAAVPPGCFVNMGLGVDQATALSIGADGPSLGGCGGSCVKSVDVEKGTITFDDKAMPEVAGKTFTVAKDANIVIDGKPGTLARVPVGSYVNLTLRVDGQTVGQLHANGPSNVCDCGGSLLKVVDVERRTITFDDKARGEVAGKTFTLARDAVIAIDGKPGTLAAVPPGAYVQMNLCADRQTVGMIFAQGPSNVCDCGGSLVKAVDAQRRTITFDDTARVEVAGKTFAVAKDAVIAVDGNPGTLAAVPPGASVQINLCVDCQTVGTIFAQGPPVPGVGVVKSVDAEKDTITVDDKTYPVAKNANILIDGKTCKLAGVRTGVYVSLRLCVDQQTVGTIFHTKAP
jgi:RNA polymerase sigma factor (sigma-70 family)